MGPGVAVGSKRHQVWAGAAALLVVVGVLGSIFAAASIPRDNAAKSRQSFVSSSVEIASTLQLAILHEQDLMFERERLNR